MEEVSDWSEHTICFIINSLAWSTRGSSLERKLSKGLKPSFLAILGTKFDDVVRSCRIPISVIQLPKHNLTHQMKPSDHMQALYGPPEVVIIV